MEKKGKKTSRNEIEFALKFKIELVSDGRVGALEGGERGVNLSLLSLFELVGMGPWG